MYTTVGDIKNEISSDNPIDNRNGNKKVARIGHCKTKPITCLFFKDFTFHDCFPVRVCGENRISEPQIKIMK